MTVRRNVLIFHTGALGDFVLSWPLALALGRLYPQSRIIYVTHGQKGRLAEKVLRVEWVDIEQQWHLLFMQKPELPEQNAKLLAGAHSIFSFVSVENDLWSRNVRELAGEAEVVSLRTTVVGEFRGHASEFLLGQLGGVPAVRAVVEQMLRSIAQRGVGGARGKNGDVVIHPGAGSAAKCWPVENYMAVAEQLIRQGRQVRVVLGEVELERWGDTETLRWPALAKVLRLGSYLELLAELGGAGVFVGNDSGPAHLAAMIGVPTLCLFGPTSERLWRPMGPKVRTLRAWPMEKLGVHEVVEELQELRGN